MTDARPLYLLATHPIEVTWDEPALTVEVPGTAAAFYPLTRVGRVISRGPVQWSGAALAGCLRHRVPVLFVADDGGLQGVLSPARQPPADLSQHLAAAMLAPEWPQRYDNWRCGQERRLINQLAAALDWSLPDARAPGVQRRLDQALRQRWGVAPQALLATPMAALRAAVAQGLLDHGINGDLATGAWGEACLAADFTRLLAWPLRGRLLAASHPPPLDPGGAVGYYEQQLAAPLARSLARLVRRLWQIAL